MARRARLAFFNVRTRYTPGSPAQVPEETARKVAQEERDAFSHHLEGIYGVQNQVLAQKTGLSRIVYLMEERKSGWLIYDVLTRERYERLSRYKPRQRVDVWSDIDGWVSHEVIAHPGETSDVVVRRLGPDSPRYHEENVIKDRVRLTQSVVKFDVDSAEWPIAWGTA